MTHNHILSRFLSRNPKKSPGPSHKPGGQSLSSCVQCDKRRNIWIHTDYPWCKASLLPLELVVYVNTAKLKQRNKQRRVERRAGANTKIISRRAPSLSPLLRAFLFSHRFKYYYIQFILFKYTLNVKKVPLFHIYIIKISPASK